jgi:hypothetical protein
MGPMGIRAARSLVGPLFRSFFRDIPEAKFIFNIDQMISDGLAFDYNGIASSIVEKSWIPSYCVG